MIQRPYNTFDLRYDKPCDLRYDNPCDLPYDNP